MKLGKIASVAWGLAAGTAAVAQTVPDSTPASDEIVVTAQLRAQNPIDVPITLAVVTGAEQERLRLDEFETLARFVPGFTVQNEAPNNPGFVIRGITSDSGAAYTEPRVSIYQDGVSIAKSRGSYVELFDLDRVEVAKGPQSTLYGRGALIGAVNLISNRADPRGAEGVARAEYGNHDAKLIEGMANLPVADDVAVRLAGRYRDRDGYVANLLGGRDFKGGATGAVRGSLHAATGALKLDLIGNWERDTTGGTPFKSMSFRPTDPVTGAVLGDTRVGTGAALAPAAGFEDGRPLGNRRTVWSATALASYDLADRLKLDAVGAYRRFDALGIFDGDGLSLPVLTAGDDVRGRQVSQDLRLTWSGERLTAFVAASYFHESGSERTPATFDERAILARLAGALSGPIPGRPATDPAPAAAFANTAFTGALVQGVAAASGVALPAAQAMAIAANLKPAHAETATNFSRTDAFDVFGDATWRIGDALELGAGLRWSHDDKRTRYTAAVLNGRSILGGFLGALQQPAATRAALLGALAVPGAATIPPSAAYPVPLFGLGVQPTAGNGGVDTANLKDDGFSWRFTARYEPARRTSVYATYARGRRPRVLAASSPAAPFGGTTFDRLPNERVDSYEIGVKSALADRRLFLDGALFRYDYRNFQTIVQQGTQFVTTNAGRARSTGAEAQARWVPNDLVTLIASYAYNHGRFRSGVRAGNRFRLSPDHMAALALLLDVPAGAGRIRVTPGVTYQSRVYFDDDNDRADLQRPPASLVADLVRDETQAGYLLANLRLGYAPDRAPWRVEAFATNLFGRHYLRDAGNTGDAIGLATFVPGDPRFYGVSLTVRLGDVR